MSMKKVVQVQVVEGEGLAALLNQRITLFCTRYIYTGQLVGINDDCVLLEDAAIVYETGPLSNAEWSTVEALPGPWYVQLQSIESFGVLKQ